MNTEYFMNVIIFLRDLTIPAIHNCKNEMDSAHMQKEHKEHKTTVSLSHSCKQASLSHWFRKSKKEKGKR